MRSFIRSGGYCLQNFGHPINQTTPKHVLTKIYYTQQAGAQTIAQTISNRSYLYSGSNLRFSRQLSVKHDSDNKGTSASSGRSKARSIMELMRWDKPTGTLLALTPSLWSLCLMNPETSCMPNIDTFIVFTAGAIAARGIGCTINDILDRNYDKHVERTKLRPIACGDISVKEAIFYLVVQGAVGLYILCLNNCSVIGLGLISSLMISSYPLFKRFTHWPQIMLAFTINWGVLMGHAAAKGSISMEDLPLLLPTYLGAIFWTLFYDTIYAHQDKNDDVFIGVKSSALKLGVRSKTFLLQMCGGMSLSLIISGMVTEQMWPYYLSVISTGLYNAKLLQSLDLGDKDDCWSAFNLQKYIGLSIFGGALFSILLKNMKHKSSANKSETEGYEN